MGKRPHFALGPKIRQLRKERHWSQRDLARLLGLSQNRLSELERGKGSFSAEHFLILLREFNITVDTFVAKRPNSGTERQNALARFGAYHLRTHAKAVPTQTYDSAARVLFDVLEGGDSFRHIAALAPVLIANPHAPERAWTRFQAAGLQRRLGWVVENTLCGIRDELRTPLSTKARLNLGRAEVVLADFLKLRFHHKKSTGDIEDILDADISTPQAAREARHASSSLSKAWGILSRIQREDFRNSIREAHETD